MATREVTDGPLNGLGVLVTRPAGRAGGLCTLIEQAGGEGYRFPVLEIVEPANPAAVTAAFRGMRRYDLVIFVSPSAAEMAARLWSSSDWTEHGRVAVAVGAGTAKALAHAGIAEVLVGPPPFSSAALLGIDEMQSVAGKRILIVRGQTGGVELGERLRERGAGVRYLQSYRRRIPDVDPAPVLKIWGQGRIHAVVVTSRESLRNLLTITGDRGRCYLRTTALVVNSAASGVLARELGVGAPLRVAAVASDHAIVDTLIEVWNDAGRQRLIADRGL